MSRLMEINSCRECRHSVGDGYRFYCGKDPYKIIDLEGPIPHWCSLPKQIPKTKKARPAKDKRRRVKIGYGLGDGYEGYLIDFGISYDELQDDKIGHYTTAIVESSNGNVTEVPVSSIQFIDKKTST